MVFASETFRCVAYLLEAFATTSDPSNNNPLANGIADLLLFASFVIQFSDRTLTTATIPTVLEDDTPETLAGHLYYAVCSRRPAR